MNDPDRVPDLLLERYRLDELPAADRSALERRLAEDVEARQRLQGIEADDADIRRQQPPGWLAEQVRARLNARRIGAGERPRAARGWAWSAALASAAALALVVVAREPWSGRRAPGASPSLAPPDASTRPSAVAPTAATASRETASDPAPVAAATESSGDRIKGLRPALTLFLRTAAGSEPLADGARARSGDVVRLCYQAAGRSFGAIISIDGRGTVTRHLPARGSRAIALQPGRVLLADAYELDDAPRFERFYLVVAATPFDLAPVLEAARRAAATPELRLLPLPRTFEQSTFSIEKEEPR